MARLNRAFVINEQQGYSLPEATNALRNSADVNFQGYNRANSQKKFFLTGYQAHINRVLLWLASKPNDYIRQSLKGGVLYSLLAQKSGTEDLKAWEAEIKTRFNADFSQDLSIITLDLNLNKETKTLGINMIVQDNITKAMIPVTTGVTL